MVLRSGFLLGDTSLVAYFDADVDDSDPTSWAEWWATVTDVESGAEQRSVVLGRSDLARCGTPREFCRSFGAADGWTLVEGRDYTVTVTVRRPGGTEETSLPSAAAKPRRTVVPPSLPAAQAAGCACPNALGRTVGAQELRGALVNTATGAFVRTERDLGMPSYGIPFEAIRFYSSANPTSGMFGPGWSWTYDARVVAAADGAVRVRAEDGAEAVYQAAADGSYTRPPGVRSKLVKVDGGWHLIPPDQRTLAFDADGRLLSVRNVRGHGVTLTYDATGLLTKLTDAGGRVVAVEHQADVRLIKKLTLPDRRSVRFEYESGRLAKVKDARDHHWRYHYDADGRLAKVIDPRGSVDVQNTYEADGRVTEQRDAVDAVTRFGWDPARQEARTTDADGVITIDGYRDNVLLFTQNGNNDVVNHRYDGRLHRNLVVDPKGNQEESRHDAEGNPTSRTAPAPFGYTEQNTFDARNNLTNHTDGRGNAWSYAYNDKNEMTGQANPEQKDGYKYTYDARALVTTRIDPRGKVTRYEYDKDGNRTAEIAPTGRRTELKYDLTGRLTAVTDPRGTVPKPATDRDDFTTRYRYDEQDRLTERHDPNKDEPYRISYDEVGNVVVEKDPLGNAGRYTYDRANRLVEGKDPKGNVTRYAYTAAGRRTSVKDAEHNITSWTYDAQGRVKTETTPRGNADDGDRRAEFTSTYHYDFNGNLIRATRPYPDGGVVQVDTKFDELNRPVGQVDELGKSTTIGYDNGHNVTSMTDENNQSLGYSYDKSGRRTGGTDAVGQSAAAIEYDDAGNTTKQTSPTGGVTTYQYDDDGRVVAVTEPRGHLPGADPAKFTTRYTYDRAGNPETVTDPLGNVTRSTYDANNRVVAQTDANGKATKYRYDEADRLAVIVGPDATGHDRTDAPATTYRYDANGLVTTRTDPLGRATEIRYDRANRPVASTDPLDRRREYRYDPDSNVVELITATEDDDDRTDGDPRKRTVFTNYDNLGRLTEKKLGTDGPRYTYRYDGKNRLVSLTDPTGVRSHEYDDTDRLTKVVRGEETFTYAYDANDNIIGRTYPDGTRITSTVDVGDRVESLTATKGGSSARFEFDYDVADQLTRTRYPASTGLVEDRAYDPAGRLTQVSSKRGDDVVSQYDLVLDPVGNPSRITTTRGGTPGRPAVTEATAYTFDPANRLTAACYGAQSCAGPAAERLEYSYDLVGNRTRQKKTAPGENSVTKYHYDDADQLRKEVTTGSRSAERTYDYDAEGNQTRAGGDRFAYHLDHTLASARVAGKTTAYDYDAAGTRVSSTTGSGAEAVVRRWSWDVNSPMPMLASETETSGNTTQRRSYLHGSSGQPLALLTPSAAGHDAHAYLHDWLGGVAGVVSPTGTPEWSYDYDPYGNARGTDLEKGGRKHADDAPDNPLQFTGGYADETQGNRYHLRARNYDPSTGRFDSTDPVAPASDAPAISSYAYAGDRPTAATDPSGLMLVANGGGGGPVSTPAETTETDQNTADGAEDSEVDPFAQQRESARKAVEEAENAVKQIGDEIVNLILDLVGFNDAKKCVTEGDIVACISTALQAVPWGKLFKAAKVLVKAVGVGKRLIEGYGRLRSARSALESIPKAVRKVTNGETKAANAAADAAKKAATATKQAATKAKETAKKVSASAKRKADCNSFAPGTLVVLADGSAKPIEKLTPGDTVLATNPQTGVNSPEQVSAVMTGTGPKKLIDLTLVGAGAGGGGPPASQERPVDSKHVDDDSTPAADAPVDTTPRATGENQITATDGHPFWTANRGWVKAGDLVAGDRLRDSAGRGVTVAAIGERAVRTTVHNITVDDQHTYYVRTADGLTALNHNSACGDQVPYGKDDLSRKAAQHRLDHNIKGGQNVAVVEWQVGRKRFTEAFANIPKSGDTPGVHSEELIQEFLTSRRIKASNVTRIYSEREVCGKCNPILAQYSRAAVTWSFRSGSWISRKKAGIAAAGG